MWSRSLRRNRRSRTARIADVTVQKVALAPTNRKRISAVRRSTSFGTT
ncbi:hypothetical protein ACFPRL_22030 [Pseudoclavibacter helvolus]